MVRDDRIGCRAIQLTVAFTSLVFSAWCFAGAPRVKAAVPSEGLPEFAYQNLSLRVVRADGKPVAGALVYGFCRDLNLLWPRGEQNDTERNSWVWEDSFLEKTDKAGQASIKVPPGKWGFYALGRSDDEESHAIVAAWSDFRVRHSEEMVQLTAGATRGWTLTTAHGDPLKASQIFLRPEGFPVWLPVGMEPGAEGVNIAGSAGAVEMWACGNAGETTPGFVLDFGKLSSTRANGKLTAIGKTATLNCTGGDASCRLMWDRYQGLGLRGEIALAPNAKVLLSSEPLSIGYRRPVPGGLTGVFSKRLYSVSTGETGTLNLSSPLTTALEQSFAASDDNGARKLDARLFVLDGNGQLVIEALDKENKPVPFSAKLTIGGREYPAPAVHVARRHEEKILENFSVVSADVGGLQSDKGAAWEFISPPGLLSEPKVSANETGPAVTVSGMTFKTEVPRALARSAQDVLLQADLLGRLMDQASGRVRRHTPTDITLNAQSGASAGHNGEHMTMGSSLLYSDPILNHHAFLHELGHNYGYTHGGLMETVVEATRCGPNPQISQQPVKWMFFDRMNGIQNKETGYPESGMYFYFFAQGGMPFLRFISINEQQVIRQLENQGFSDDELRAAVCSVALHRDVGPIFRQYGLNAPAEKVEQAMKVVRPLCRNP